MLEINKIYNMDCLDGMRLMKEQGIKADWVLTDPPYGIGIDGQKLSINKNPKHNRKAFEHKGWDNSTPDKSIFDLIVKTDAIAKQGIKNDIICAALKFKTNTLLANIVFPNAIKFIKEAANDYLKRRKKRKSANIRLDRQPS